MRVRHVKVAEQNEQSFRITREVVPYFYNPLHFHTEVELTYILQSHGTAFIGDFIGTFQPGDVFLLGEKLPHNFKNASAFFAKDSNLNAEALVFHFDHNFLGADLWTKPEMKEITGLLREARKGILLAGETRTVIQNMMKDLVNLSQVNRLLSLIQILDVISTSTEKKILSTSLPSASFSNADAEKLNKINSYTMMHYRTKVPLKTIASVVNMNPSAFCRYFKLRTKRSFSQFVIELRLQQATNMLIESTLTIDRISHECGFESPSYFYRTFKRYKGITPAAYQKRLR
ncbi:MAG TPA: AraC family transcriptional regulator [Chitinophagaceae bacterium]|nr:AraC family transcriptional regulator [Chitinophagaceae bacterium]